MKSFRIKICGIKQPEHAEAAAEAGADAIGLNFYERSLRSVTVEQAKLVSRAMPSGVAKVGVFVNMPVAGINQVAQEVGLDWVQLHGDESPEIVSQIEKPTIRAVRVAPAAVLNDDSIIQKWIDAGARTILLDAKSDKAYGGTGETINWTDVSKFNLSVPLILAGGLKPENVVEAIRVSGSDGVDTASGVESFPAGKSVDLIREFIGNAISAFDKRKEVG